jgi:hypothetical protein
MLDSDLGPSRMYPMSFHLVIGMSYLYSVRSTKCIALDLHIVLSTVKSAIEMNSLLDELKAVV